MKTSRHETNISSAISEKNDCKHSQLKKMYVAN